MHLQGILFSTHLHRHGDPPSINGIGTDGLAVRDAKIDPEADERTQLVADFEEAGQYTADGRDR